MYRVLIRDVIRSSDIRTFDSRSEVRIQFLHPDVRINYLKCKKMNIVMQKNSVILSQNEITWRFQEPMIL